MSRCAPVPLMPLRSRAAILQIDPLFDADDYNTMLRMEGDVGLIPDHDLVGFVRSHPDRIRHQLAMRLRTSESGIGSCGRGGRSVTDDLDERPDATVIDLGGFSTPAESRAAALAVLDHLWEQPRAARGPSDRHRRGPQPVHARPGDAVEKLLTERIVQIAAEGRKYGLWLLLSTQRPSKLHPNALSQCDNLALMRMSSPRDLAELAGVFGYAPESLLERSTGFAQGQALFAGGFVDQPSLVQMGARLTPKAERRRGAAALSVAASPAV